MTDESLVREVMDEFRKLVHILRSSHRAAQDIDITGAQLFVLSILAEAVDAMSMNELAQRTQTDPSTVSVVIGRLVDRGLVKRVRSGEDARRAELSLTAKGRKLRKRAPVTVAQERLADSLGRLKPREVASLLRTLRKLVEAMGAGGIEPSMMCNDAVPNGSERNRKRRRRPATKS